MRSYLLFSLLCCACGSQSANQSLCTPDSVGAPTTTEAAPLSVIPLGAAAGHFHTVPLRLNGRVVTTAILDTGIGLALVSKALCERLDCTLDGEFSGQRMSGQTVTLPLTHIDRIELGGLVQENVVAGVVDIEGFFPEPQIEAFIGLPFFEETPFTIDAEHSQLILESESSLRVRQAQTQALPVRFDRHGVALDIFVPMVLPDGSVASMLMDTGSFGITLHTRYAEAMGVDFDAPSVERRSSQDETGYTYERFYTTLERPLTFQAAPTLRRSGLRAMFQEIIHDGLIGTELMSSYVMTYDLPRSRVLIGRRQDERSTTGARE